MSTDPAFPFRALLCVQRVCFSPHLELLQRGVRPGLHLLRHGSKVHRPLHDVQVVRHEPDIHRLLEEAVLVLAVSGRPENQTTCENLELGKAPGHRKGPEKGTELGKEAEHATWTGAAKGGVQCTQLHVGVTAVKTFS